MLIDLACCGAGSMKSPHGWTPLRTAFAATLDTLSTDVDDLKTQLAVLLKKEQEKDIQPRRWAARATRKDWNNLIDWVDRLTADYSLLGDSTVPPCWPAHPGVVEELAGLWRSWTRTMIIDELAKGSGDTSLTAWHDRWLWPCLTRMKNRALPHHQLPHQTPTRDLLLPVHRSGFSPEHSRLGRVPVV